MAWQSFVLQVSEVTHYKGNYGMGTKDLFGLFPASPWSYDPNFCKNREMINIHLNQ